MPRSPQNVGRRLDRPQAIGRQSRHRRQRFEPPRQAAGHGPRPDRARPPPRRSASTVAPLGCVACGPAWSLWTSPRRLTDQSGRGPRRSPPARVEGLGCDLLRLELEVLGLVAGQLPGLVRVEGLDGTASKPPAKSSSIAVNSSPVVSVSCMGRPEIRCPQSEGQSPPTHSLWRTASPSPRRRRSAQTSAGVMSTSIPRPRLKAIALTRCLAHQSKSALPRFHGGLSRCRCESRPFGMDCERHVPSLPGRITCCCSDVRYVHRIDIKIRRPHIQTDIIAAPLGPVFQVVRPEPNHESAAATCRSRISAQASRSGKVDSPLESLHVSSFRAFLERRHAVRQVLKLRAPGLRRPPQPG